MCAVGPWNCSHASLTSPEALAGLRELRTTNPTLHAELTQTDVAQPDITSIDSVQDDDPFEGDVAVYDDCDIPLDVVSAHLTSSGSSIATNFSVSANGGITRSGDAEASDAEEEVAPLGRGQRRKIVARRYQGALWEEH
ncbi:hypothetical protein B0H16DRAFT_1455723 [Mycena metata]|uniref:Uncharacterized protein n=1 Tax=Mycena metata TaxID=1033252 RepID=A0AAD7NIF0_9AGAR|nr:hypothetical protein B0H16DRAFT_1455723 [Mycena metata]